MPTYEYKGVEFTSERELSAEEWQQTLSYLDTVQKPVEPPKEVKPPEEASTWDSIKGGFVQGAHQGATALEAASVGGLSLLEKLASGLGKEDKAQSLREMQEPIIENTMQRKEWIEKEGPLANKTQSELDKVLGVAGSLPSLLNPVTLGLNLGGGAADTGIQLLKDGGSLQAAESGLAVDAALSLGAVAAPASLIKGPWANATATAALNIVQDTTNRFLQNAIRKQEDIKQLPDMTIGDYAASGVTGGIIGGMLAKPHQPGTSRIDSSSKLTPEAPTKAFVDESALIKNQMDSIQNRVNTINSIDEAKLASPEEKAKVAEMKNALPSLQKELVTLQESYLELTNPAAFVQYNKLKQAQIDKENAELSSGVGSAMQGQRMWDNENRLTTPVAGYVESLRRSIKATQDYEKLVTMKEAGDQTTGDGLNIDARLKAAKAEMDRLDLVVSKAEENLTGRNLSYEEILTIRNKVEENLSKIYRGEKVSLHDEIDLNYGLNPKELLVKHFVEDPKASTMDFINAYYKQEISDWKSNVGSRPVKTIGKLLGDNSNLLSRILRSTGLESEPLLVINLADLPKAARQHINVAGYHLRSEGMIILNPEKFHSLFLDTSVNGKLFMDHFKNDIVKLREFQEAYVLTHELGHKYMHDLLKFGFLDEKTGTDIVNRFQKYIKDNPENSIRDYSLISHKDMETFNEFFADQFLNKTLFDKNPISNVGIKIRKAFDSLLNFFGLSKKFSTTKAMDTLFSDYLAQNKAAMTEFGYTMFQHRVDREIGKYVGETKASEISNRFSKLSVDPNFQKTPTPLSPSLLEKELSGNAMQQNDPQKILSDMTGVPDIGTSSLKNLPNIIDKLFNFSSHVFEKGALNFFGDQQFRKVYAENPLINYIYKQIRHAEDVSVSIKKHLLFGKSEASNFPQIGPFRRLTREANRDSLTWHLDNAKQADMVKVWEMFEDGFKQNRPYQETIKLNEGTLTPAQKQLAEILAKTWHNQYTFAKKAQEALNKKHVLPFRDGWIPAVRQGDFYVTLSTNGIPVHVEAFRTKYEAENFRKNIRTQGFKKVEVSDVADVSIIKEQIGKDSSFAFDLAQSIATQLATKYPNSGIDSDINNILTRIKERGGKLGGHHEYRQGFSGYEGSKLFRDSSQKASDIRDAIYSSIDNYSRGIKRLYIIKNTADLLDTPSGLDITHPNTFDAVKTMRDMATNQLPVWTEGFDKSVRNVFDNIAASFDLYPKVNPLDRITGTTSHLFYIFTLTTRPGFWLGQALSSPLALRELLRTDSPLKAMESAGRGTWNVLSGGDADFKRAMNYIAHNFDTFHPQLKNELTKIPIIGEGGNKQATKIFEHLSGEKITAAADSFSRYYTAAMFYEHFKKQGLSGKELYRQIAEATDSTMVTYSRAHKPPVFEKLGVLGENIAPLQTFANAQLGNLVADFRFFAKNPAFKTAAPFIATMLVTSFLAGVMGAPLVAEYELLRKLLLKLDPSLEKSIPSVVEWALKGDSRLVSHGAPSVTGFDFGSSMRWNPIVSGVVAGEEAFINLFPALAFGKTAVENVGTLLKEGVSGSVPQQEVRKATLGLTPGAYKAIPDELMFGAGERDFVPGGPRGFASVEQTGKERVSTALGSKTIENARSSKIASLEIEKERTRNERINKNIDLLIDGLQNDQERKINKALDNLSDLEVPADAIKNRLKATMEKRNIPILDRMSSGRTGRLTTYDQKRKAMNLMEYEE